MRTFLATLVVWLSFTGLAWADYAIVVSQRTAADPQWQKVIEALQARHPSARVIEYDKQVAAALPDLQRAFPKYACFVATAEEASREFVADVHRLTRQLDDDPYTDCLWGILTGYDAANALVIAQESKPLIVQKAAAGTEIALEKIPAGVWHCELKSGKVVRKEAGADIAESKGPADSTAALVESLNKYHADLFVTSGHATERDWQIGYAYRNGQFQSKGGKMFGVDLQKQKLPLESNNPKVYLAVGNCLMGHIDGPDAMALAWMNSVGVRQMVGYTVLTWYGYAGWGVLDYYVEQPGRYNLAEAFYVNEQALLQRIETYFPEASNAEPDANGRPKQPIQLSPQAKEAGLTTMDGIGLLYDRDVVAFYGDPAWDARLPNGPLSYEQSLKEKDGVYTFTITPQLGEHSFEPVNTNGAQRGWRPIIMLLPERLKDIKITAGNDLKPVITDNFILVPNPRTCDPQRKYEVVFSAQPIK